MSSFKAGDIVFFRGGVDPVTIVEPTYIPSEDGEGRPGYVVVMAGWAGPEARSALSFVSYEENLEILRIRVAGATKTVVSAAQVLDRSVRDLERLREMR